jgi:hypothetical protein
VAAAAEDAVAVAAEPNEELRPRGLSPAPPPCVLSGVGSISRLPRAATLPSPRTDRHRRRRSQRGMARPLLLHPHVHARCPSGLLVVPVVRSPTACCGGCCRWLGSTHGPPFPASARLSRASTRGGRFFPLVIVLPCAGGTGRRERASVIMGNGAIHYHCFMFLLHRE